MMSLPSLGQCWTEHHSVIELTARCCGWQRCTVRATTIIALYSAVQCTRQLPQYCTASMRSVQFVLALQPCTVYSMTVQLCRDMSKIYQATATVARTSSLAMHEILSKSLILKFYLGDKSASNMNWGSKKHSIEGKNWWRVAGPSPVQSRRTSKPDADVLLGPVSTCILEKNQ